MSGRGYIAATPPDKCELCGVIDELRPYGAKGEYICFDCGMKDEATTARRFKQVVFGEEFTKPMLVDKPPPPTGE